MQLLLPPTVQSYRYDLLVGGQAPPPPPKNLICLYLQPRIQFPHVLAWYVISLTYFLSPPLFYHCFHRGKKQLFVTQFVDSMKVIYSPAPFPAV